MTTRRQFIQTIPTTAAAFAVGSEFLLDGTMAKAQTVAAQPHKDHFHPRGKAPSEHTLEVLKNARANLPFNDTRDFEENEKNLIAIREDPQIKSDTGGIAFDIGQYEFINADEIPSLHPSAHRQAKLNMNFGLYKVIDGIYQVRGFDMAQISFVRGEKGWIVVDPLVTAESARAALELFQEHVGNGEPVTAVIYSHSHVDHWGGVRGVVDEDDVRAGKVEIIAPLDFMQHLVAENVYAGNAMNRRIQYQYGLLMPASPYGHAGQGLGQAASVGAVGLIAPTRIIEDDIEYLTVDGVPMVFQNTPNTEAPSEMNTYIPGMKALFMAENICASMHNIYTLRGALVRDALHWSKYINQALHLFGTEADVLFAAHHFPRWGNERVQEVMRAQRDLYAHLNNQSLHLANSGVTINEIHNVYELPKSLQQTWHTRGYHGSPQHNSRGVVNRFLGFWDCNPATLIPLSPSDSAPLYVRMMGGAAQIMSEGQRLHDEGEYFQAQEILNKLVLAEPENREAKELLADVFEQIGYQQENPGLRHSYLAAAYELRSGIPTVEAAKSTSLDVVRTMPTEMFLEYLAIRMDSRKAEDLRFTINLVTPDNGEKFLIELENATLTSIEGFQAGEPDLTLTINRSHLEEVMGGETTLMTMIEDGTATTEGDVTVLEKLGATMVAFDPRFEIMPGTMLEPSDIDQANAYEAAIGSPPVE